MDANKSPKDNLEQVNKEQQKLFTIHKQTNEPQQQQLTGQQPPLNESHHNLLQSWHKLRELDEDLAEHKYKDMLNDSSKQDQV